MTYGRDPVLPMDASTRGRSGCRPSFPSCKPLLTDTAEFADVVLRLDGFDKTRNTNTVARVQLDGRGPPPGEARRADHAHIATEWRARSYESPRRFRGDGAPDSATRGSRTEARTACVLWPCLLPSTGNDVSSRTPPARTRKFSALEFAIPPSSRARTSHSSSSRPYARHWPRERYSGAERAREPTAGGVCRDAPDDGRARNRGGAAAVSSPRGSIRSNVRAGQSPGQVSFLSLQ